MMQKWILSIVMVIATMVAVSAQDTRLAVQYFNDGEYEKSAVLYKKLFQKSKSDYYFDKYVESLLAMEDYSTAEKAIKDQLKVNPSNSLLYVSFGKLYEDQFMPEKADEQYALAVKNLPADQFQITRLANAFVNMTKYDMAISVYEKGSKLIKDNTVFSYNLGELYRRKGGEAEKMISQYLNSLSINPNRGNSLKTVFQRYFTDEEMQILKEQLYTRIQENENALYYVDLLAWVFMQQKNYAAALRQVRALDMRYEENGGRVFKLAQIAANDKDYDTAVKAYQYIINTKGVMSSFYLDSKLEMLNTQLKQILLNPEYTSEDFMPLKADYESFLTEFGRSASTASIILQQAELEALYIHDIDAAIKLLQEIIEIRGADSQLIAKAKIQLADYYLIQGDRWESTLLYSQVDKDFKEGVIGQLARYKNAKLSYYFGDFDWAQAQFSVLKASTSKLIANDALDLSVFIMDNLGLDTTTTAMEMYAQADLMLFQNKPDSAIIILDTLLANFPDHSLDDDVIYLKAKVAVKKHELDVAESYYKEVFEKYPEDIRADNSIFELAELYENRMNRPEDAKALYEKIFLEYSNSTFAVEARKRFRLLRGDDVQ